MKGDGMGAEPDRHVRDDIEHAMALLDWGGLRRDRIVADGRFEGKEVAELLNQYSSNTVFWNCQFRDAALRDDHSLHRCVVVGCRFEAIRGRKFEIRKTFLRDTTFHECSFGVRRIMENWAVGDVSGWEPPDGSEPPWIPWEAALESLAAIDQGYTFGLASLLDLDPVGEATLGGWYERVAEAHGPEILCSIRSAFVCQFPLLYRVRVSGADRRLAEHLDTWQQVLAHQDADLVEPAFPPSLRVHGDVGFSVCLGRSPALLWVLREGDDTLLFRTTGLPYERACAHDGGRRLFYGAAASGVVLG